MFDWTTFEAAFVETTEAAIDKWFTKYPKQHPYAIAFHELYYELDGPISIPSLGINSVEKQKHEEGTDEENYKWSPADWHWTSLLPERSPLAKLEKPLIDEACSGSQAHWKKTKKHFDKILLHVTKRLYQKYSKHPQVTDDFVVYIDDDEYGRDLIKRCVPARLYKKHFDGLDKPNLSKLSPEERLAIYIKDIWSYEKEILAMGVNAIPALIEKLNDPENGWAAAGILADIGQPTEAVISALRKHARTKGGTGELSANALHLLGDVEFLYELLNSEELLNQAVDGILKGLKVGASDRKVPLPLNYSHAERLLAMNSPAIEARVIEALKPGSSFIDPKPSDLDELIRGLNSPHVPIRQHAACVAGDRALGKAVGKKLLPVLAEKLTDSVPNVRRLALLALSYWKSDAAPYHAEMKKLQKDKDPQVREYAYAVFDR
jgi:hypothetical protein